MFLSADLIFKYVIGKVIMGRMTETQIRARTKYYLLSGINRVYFRRWADHTGSDYNVLHIQLRTGYKVAFSVLRVQT